MKRLILPLLFVACATFTPPPEPSLAGETNGLLADAAAPVVVNFSSPIAEGSLRLSIARFVTDLEGNLPDEDDDPSTTLQTYFVRDEDGDHQGTADLDPGRTSLTIHPNAPLPIGPRLVLLVEPGLSDDDGNATGARRRLPFAYDVTLDCNAPARAMPSGTYFFLADVVEPVGTQVQLFAVLAVDPATGKVRGRFTNADRSRDGSRCQGLACKSTEACRQLPAPACVIPSERAASVDEFPDWVPNADGATGYSFEDDGCVTDQPDGSATLVMKPVDVAITQPQVTLRNVRLSGQFAKDAAGALRATGSMTADAVLLGTTPSGAGKGNLTARLVPEGQAPPGIPGPDSTTRSP
jgi:hypothetical protein